MKIIITENQNYILRRLHKFIEGVEELIDEYELQDNHPWWCRSGNPNSFFNNIRNTVIDEFMDQNREFFDDESEKGGANMNISILHKIVEENYGNYVRNMFVRKCGQSRW
jgi:hypothetical protein